MIQYFKLTNAVLFQNEYTINFPLLRSLMKLTSKFPKGRFDALRLICEFISSIDRPCDFSSEIVRLILFISHIKHLNVYVGEQINVYHCSKSYKNSGRYSNLPLTYNGTNGNWQSLRLTGDI